MPTTDDNFKPLTLDDVFDVDYDKEHMGKYRKINLKSGNVVHVRAEDPYGFWYITFEKGKPPEELRGSYTSFDLALRDVNIWLKAKKIPLVYGKPEVIDPVVHTKIKRSAVEQAKQTVGD